MRLLTLACSAVLLANSLLAFEPGQLSLDNVSNFEEGDAGFTIRHRFFGKADEADTAFGLDDGANTFLSLRYSPLKDFIFEVHHATLQSENNIRLGYAHKFDYLHTQFNLNYFKFEEGTNEDAKNFFANAVFQTPLIYDHITLTSNIGYDHYYDKTGAGFGIEVSTQNFMPNVLTFTESMSILAEYYTKHKDLDNFDREYNSYAFGVKFRTYGHHFELLLTNSTAVDPRTMMQGSNTTDLHFAFNINRKF